MRRASVSLSVGYWMVIVCHSDPNIQIKGLLLYKPSGTGLFGGVTARTSLGRPFPFLVRSVVFGGN